VSLQEFNPSVSHKSIDDLNFLIHSSWKTKHGTYDWACKHVHTHAQTENYWMYPVPACY